MTILPGALGTQISEPKTGAALLGQLPGKMQRAVVTREARVQATPVKGNHEPETGNNNNLRFWRPWLGKGREEERRPTLAIFQETVLASWTEATGVKTPGAEAPHFIWGGGLHTVLRSHGPSPKSKHQEMILRGLPNPELKTSAWRGKGTGCRIFSSTQAHLLDQPSPETRLEARIPPATIATVLSASA